MSNPTENAFADIAARKIERDRLAEKMAEAQSQAAKEKVTKWERDKSKFAGDQSVIRQIITNHANSLAIAGIALHEKMEAFNESEKSGRIVVKVTEDAKDTKYQINFNLSNGSVSPAILLSHSGKNPPNVPVEDANQSWYEAAILSMMEQAYPQPNR